MFLISVFDILNPGKSLSTTHPQGKSTSKSCRSIMQILQIILLIPKFVAIFVWGYAIKVAYTKSDSLIQDLIRVKHFYQKYMILDLIIFILLILQMIFVNCSVLRPSQRVLQACAIGLIGGFVWIISYILINWMIGRVVTYNLGLQMTTGILNNLGLDSNQYKTVGEKDEDDGLEPEDGAKDRAGENGGETLPPGN